VDAVGQQQERPTKLRARPECRAVECAHPATVGIEYRDTNAFIDEIPAGHGPTDQVMADAADLVSIRHTLRQLVNVEGD